MNVRDFLKSIDLDVFSATPKYLQLAQSIIQNIASGKSVRDDIVPSINELSFELDISRDTVERAYKYLKKLNILGSVPGKGFYIKNVNVTQDLKIFLLFNKLSAHKKIIYDSFVKTLGDRAAIDFYIYNNDFNFFKKLIQNARGHYTHYVLITHFLDNGESASTVINAIPKEKLILLDKMVQDVSGNFGAVYEYFESDIYTALEEAVGSLKKYETIHIIVPEYTYFPDEITKGFKRFCHQYAFNAHIIHDICKEVVEKGHAYISLMEDDLVTLIEKIVASKLKIGEEVGVISYNETPLKRLILDGITTISTDFEEMGRCAAQLILEGRKEKIANPFKLRLRPSL